MGPGAKRRGRRILPALLVLLLAAGCGPPPALVRNVAVAYPEVLFSVETADSVVALTLDDGPHAALTPRVLDLLAAHDARATFFLMGRRIPGNEALVRRIVAEGHELGNHMMTTRASVGLSPEAFTAQLHEAHAQLEAFAPVRWYRPASGWYTTRMRREAEALGYRLALGSVYPNDAQNPFVPYLACYVLRNVRPGAVVVLHDGVWHGGTAAVLRRVLPELRRRGYRVVTLSELARAAE